MSRGDTRQKGVPISHHSADNTSKMSFKSLNSRFSLFLLLLVDVSLKVVNVSLPDVIALSGTDFSETFL